MPGFSGSRPGASAISPRSLCNVPRLLEHDRILGRQRQGRFGNGHRIFDAVQVLQKAGQIHGDGVIVRVMLSAGAIGGDGFFGTAGRGEGQAEIEPRRNVPRLNLQGGTIGGDRGFPLALLFAGVAEIVMEESVAGLEAKRRIPRRPRTLRAGRCRRGAVRDCCSSGPPRAECGWPFASNPKPPCNGPFRGRSLPVDEVNIRAFRVHGQGPPGGRDSRLPQDARAR